jgi:hypothetical protein
MPFGKFRGDRWAFLGAAMTLALFIFGPRLALVFVDLNVRFMVIVAGIAGFAVASVLMFYKGPDRES